MASMHVRSNSLPSKSHPIVNDVEDQLQRLRSSEGASTSVCANLASLRDLHMGIENLIQMPSIQQALAEEKNWTNELLEESLRIMDLCEFAQEILSLSKESVQELQSTLRRSRGETCTKDVVNAYAASRKKISKMVGKFIKNSNKKSTPFLNEDADVKAVFEMLKEAAAFDLSVLKSALVLLSDDEGRSKKRRRSFLSMFTQTSSNKICDAADMENLANQLKSSEATMQELDEELEAFYRTLVKSRVSLLNALNH